LRSASSARNHATHAVNSVKATSTLDLRRQLTRCRGYAPRMLSATRVPVGRRQHMYSSATFTQISHTQAPSHWASELFLDGRESFTELETDGRLATMKCERCTGNKTVRTKQGTGYSRRTHSPYWRSRCLSSLATRLQSSLASAQQSDVSAVDSDPRSTFALPIEAHPKSNLRLDCTGISTRCNPRGYLPAGSPRPNPAGTYFRSPGVQLEFPRLDTWQSAVDPALGSQLNAPSGTHPRTGSRARAGRAGNLLAEHRMSGQSVSKQGYAHEACPAPHWE